MYLLDSDPSNPEQFRRYRSELPFGDPTTHYQLHPFFWTSDVLSWGSVVDLATVEEERAKTVAGVYHFPIFILSFIIRLYVLFNKKDNLY